ncbi:MAG: cytochrome c3 family protein [Nitrospirae bacterium]|nr:cytochrome c3 family protein [Nitrospirota bacterium]
MKIIFAFLSVLIFAVHAWAIRSNDCNICHESHHGFIIKRDVTELCKDCHKERISAGEHKVDVQPTMDVPKDLPLKKDGKITCITCHDSHSKEYLMLRYKSVELCYKCHKK